MDTTQRTAIRWGFGPSLLAFSLLAACGDALHEVAPSAREVPVDLAPRGPSAAPREASAPLQIAPIQTGPLQTGPMQTGPLQEERPSSSDDPYQGWRTYDVTGGSLRYPSDWTAKETPAGLQLIPEGGTATDETVLVIAVPAPGVRDAASIQVAAALDAMVADAAPGMRRESPPAKVSAGGGRTGARYDYAGRQLEGRNSKASIFVVLEGGHAAAVGLLGSPEAVERRRATALKIFRSLSSSEPGRQPIEGGDTRRDPRLVGVFAGEAIHTGDSMYVNTQLVYALQEDGLVLYGARSAINGARRSAPGGGWTFDASTSGDVMCGRWSTENGALSIRWDSGSTAVVSYGFEPDGTLALRQRGTGQLINIFRRVR